MPRLTPEKEPEHLDSNVEYVRCLICTGRVKAKKYGRIWLLAPGSVERPRNTLKRQIKEGYSKYDPQRGIGFE